MSKSEQAVGNYNNREEEDKLSTIINIDTVKVSYCAFFNSVISYLEFDNECLCFSDNFVYSEATYVESFPFVRQPIMLNYSIQETCKF